MMGADKMILRIKKTDRGLFYDTGEIKGYLKDSLFLADLVHELQPDKVIVLE